MASDAAGTVDNSDGGAERNGTPRLSELLERLVSETDGKTVSIDEILDALGSQSFGPMLLIPAIIAVAPTGAIPGMSLVTGTIIFLVSLQILVGREHIWLPKRVTSFEFERSKLKSSVKAAKPWTDWLQDLFSQRLTFLVEQPALKVIAVTCMLLAASMFPLALLPFAVAVPGTAVGLFALGVTMRDGLLVALGYALALGAAYLIWTVI